MTLDSVLKRWSTSCVVLVALVAPLVTGHPVAWSAAPSGVATIAGSVLFSVLAGFALALALRNAVGPIMLLLVWPTVALLIGSMSDAALRASVTWTSIRCSASPTAPPTA